MQRQFEFPRKPNRPNNWFSSDFIKAASIALGEGDLNQTTFGLLCFIVQFEHGLRYERFPRFHERQLSERAGLPKTTMRECRGRAIAGGWLEIRPTPRGTEYEVKIPPAYEGEPRCDRRTEQPLDERSESGRIPVAPRPKSDQNPTILYPSSPVPSPSTPNPWEVVAKRLREIGLMQATRATEIAARNALSPEQVQSWIDFITDEARTGDYGPGVLFNRISNPDARSFPADYGWPPANPQGKQHRERRQRDERERREAEDRRRQSAEDAAAIERRKERTTQLELQFGAELDALPIESQLALISEEFTRRVAQQQVRTRGRVEPGMIRQQMLEAMAAQYGDN